MNTPLDTIIAGELAKIDLMRAKIKERRWVFGTCRVRSEIGVLSSTPLGACAPITSLAKARSGSLSLGYKAPTMLVGVLIVESSRTCG